MPSIRQAYSSISQEEKQRLLSSANTITYSSSSTAAMAVRSKPTSSAVGRTEQTRSHGFPDSRDHANSQAQEFAGPQNRDRRRSSSGRGRPLCDHCGNLGHWIQKCYKLHGYPPGHPKAKKNSSQNSNRHKGISMANQVREALSINEGSITISNAQLKQLFSLLNNQNECSNSKANAVTKPGSGYEEDD